MFESTPQEQPQEPIEQPQVLDAGAETADDDLDKVTFGFEPQAVQYPGHPDSSSGVDMSGYDRPIGLSGSEMAYLDNPLQDLQDLETARLMDRYLAEAGLTPEDIDDAASRMSGLEEPPLTYEGPVAIDMDKLGLGSRFERLTGPDCLPPTINTIPPENRAPSPPNPADLTEAIGRAVSEERFAATSQGGIGDYAQEMFGETLRQAPSPPNPADLTEAIGRAVSEERFAATSQGGIGDYAQEMFGETLRQVPPPDNASPETPESVDPNAPSSHTPDQPRE